MRFIVGYTDTPQGHDALALASRMAVSFGAILDITVVLDNVHSGAVSPPNPAFSKYLREQAISWLDNAKSRIPDGIEVHRQVVFADNPPEGLIQTARDLKADIVVIGASKRGFLGRMKLGALGSTLVHSSPLPVAIAPSGYRDTDASSPLTRVTAAIGEGSGAKNLLSIAMRAARRAAVPLRLLSIVSLDIEPGASEEEVEREQVSHLAELEDTAMDMLHSVSDPHSGSDLTIELAVASGRSMKEAVRSVAWEPCEIVLLGSSRLAPKGGTFLGITATRILRELPVPSIAVPRKAGKSLKSKEEQHG